MKQIKLMDIPLTIGSYNDFVDNIVEAAEEKRRGYACIANVHTIVESHRNKEFARDIWNASITTPDGKPLTWALKLVYGITQDRVAGMDLLPDLIKKSADRKLSVFFYGGKPEALDITRDYMHKNFPDLEIKGLYSPPFRALTKKEEDADVEAINNSGADILFVVLGCPKQERWMAKMADRINPFMLGVGGALPVMIGLQKRAPVWMQNAGFEWFYRMMLEPRRLFKRYAVTNTLFIVMLFRRMISYRWDGKISTTFENS